jgi:hypothetical protein
MKKNKGFKIFRDLTQNHIVFAAESYFAGVLAFRLTPNDNPLLVSVGGFKFGLIVGLTTFILLELIRWVFSSIRRRIKNSKKEKEEQIFFDQSCRYEQSNLEELWSFVDKLNTEDYYCLLCFVETKNAPMVLTNAVFAPERLFSSDNVIVITIKTSKNLSGLRSVKKQYCLKSEFYDLLSYSVKKHRTISHLKGLLSRD